MPKLLYDPQQHPEATFDDCFLVPNNPIHAEVMDACSSDDERQLLNNLQDLAEARSDRTHAMDAIRRYRTMLLDCAEKYQVGNSFSRDQVDLTPAGGLANTCVVVANMNETTGVRMARAIAHVGGIAAIPQDKSDDEVLGIISALRETDPVYDTAVKIVPDVKVHEFRRLLAKRSHTSAVVTDPEGHFLGLLSDKDIPQGLNQDTSVEPYIRRYGNGHTNDIVTAQDGIEPLEAIHKMSHVHYLPILDSDNRVVGVLPRIDAAMRLRYKPNVDTINGGLRAIFTVGALNANPMDRIRLLIDQGIGDILFDTAHFDQGIQPYRNIERAVALAAQRNVSLNLIAGNVVTREATRNIIATGAKFVKVGIGPGAMCTTRMQTGVGRPQVSAVLECAEEAQLHGGHIIADGGISHPRDVALAIAAGADYVMVGTLFAGTYESPPDLQHDEKGDYKITYGMASVRASVLRTFGRSHRNIMDVFRDSVGHRSEGLSEGRVYLKRGRESVALVHHDLLDGLGSAMAYARSRTISDFHNNAVIGLQTPSGFIEGTPKTVS